MSSLRITSVALLLMFAVVLGGCGVPPSSMTTLTITSDSFRENATIPREFTCDGAGLRPNLAFGGIPEGTASLAIIVSDPDAPSGTFIHWTAWNIDPALTYLPGTDPLSRAVQGVTGTGRAGYVGPCPPTGTHRYIFTLYAVSTQLDLPASSTIDELKAALIGQVLAEATLTGLYSRGGIAASSPLAPSGALADSDSTRNTY